MFAMHNVALHPGPAYVGTALSKPISVFKKQEFEFLLLGALLRSSFTALLHVPVLFAYLTTRLPHLYAR